MASTKSVRFNSAADVTHYDVEEYVEDLDTCETWADFEENDDALDVSPCQSIDSTLSDVVEAVYRARKLRASVEQDLRRSSRSEAHRSYQAEDSKFAEHAPSSRKSTSLLGQLWRRLNAPGNLGTCRKQGKSAGSKNVLGRRRWGSIEIFQVKHHFMNKKAKEDAWTQSLYGVGPSNTQTSAVMDTPVPASVSASSAPLSSHQSPQKKTFWFRARVAPEMPL
eukprot:TRINITY_DN14443_c0_g1_i1.p1 TRINITY_DN14443_c0_g1~~TRINITY_DN14443_c0_g1_i1.p1  ORF type:complete len:222 (+),score=35.14 TRINITY_DN14443_c0_g1_i1:73-738(+)